LITGIAGVRTIKHALHELCKGRSRTALIAKYHAFELDVKSVSAVEELSKLPGHDATAVSDMTWRPHGYTERQCLMDAACTLHGLNAGHTERLADLVEDITQSLARVGHCPGGRSFKIAEVVVKC